jgi:serine phosphatase RsbU (regulator of sigma subunit)
MVAHKYNKEVKEGQLLVLACSQQVRYNEIGLETAPEPRRGELFHLLAFGKDVTRSRRTIMDLQPDLELQVAVAKVSKYAVSESGDTVEVIERPHGGLSLVLVDGQRSGKSAKAISNIVARKAVSLLADGVRDGAAARAAHDYLRTMRGGQVSATLNIVSVDLGTRTIVVSRNSHCPAIVANGRDGQLQLLDEPSQPIGIHSRTRPVITELPIAADQQVVVFTDGILSAGVRYGQRFDAAAFVRNRLTMGTGEASARSLADALLARAFELDQGRPGDDISVVVLAVIPRQQPDDVRRMSVRFPI